MTKLTGLPKSHLRPCSLNCKIFVPFGRAKFQFRLPSRLDHRSISSLCFAELDYMGRLNGKRVGSFTKSPQDLASTQASTVTRAMLALAVSKRTGLCSPDEARDLLDRVLSEIKSSLTRGEKVKIGGFATFSPHLKEERIARNIRIGTSALVSARIVVRVVWAKAVKQAVASGTLRQP